MCGSSGSKAAHGPLAAISWGVYCALIGYVGGHAFEDQPLKGLALGFVLSLLVAGTIEVIRHRRRRRVAGPRREG